MTDTPDRCLQCRARKATLCSNCGTEYVTVFTAAARELEAAAREYLIDRSARSRLNNALEQFNRWDRLRRPTQEENPAERTS